MSTTPSAPRYLLPLIVVAQFFGTSLWFAGNAVLPALQRDLSLPASAVGDITSAVQLGFIVGTLVFAFLSVADRFSPSRVFWVCAWAGALANVGIFWAQGPAQVLAFRALTGFFLAGIYPVGMKISADWFAGSLGKALGWLVGALVLGTAFPHLIRATGQSLDWHAVMGVTSGAAALGGLLVGVFVKDGPSRKRGQGFKPAVLFGMFKVPGFRAASLGYFGHMWELYSLWAFVPLLLGTYSLSDAGVSGWSFGIIAMGSVGCVLGGYLAQRSGSARVAKGMLLASGLFCLAAPGLLQLPLSAALPLLLVWGMVVAGDSPQFSTLAAKTAPPEVVGTALTLMNSLGFALTIVSLQVLTWATQSMEWGPYAYWVLVPGPLLGLLAVRRLRLS